MLEHLITSLLLPLFVVSCTAVDTEDIPQRKLYVSFYFAPPPAAVSKAAPVYQGFASSDDRGNNWMNLGWLTSSVSGMDVDPANTDRVYLATDYGVLRSTNGGVQWKQISGWEMPTVLAVRCTPQSVWAATAAGVYQSTDDGERWRARSVGLPAPNGTYIADMELLPGSLLIATADGIYRSTNDGGSWFRSGLNGTAISGIAIHPKDPALMAAFSQERGIWISTDGGRSWEDRNASLEFPNVKCAAFDARDRSSLLIGTTRAGVLRSSDLGVHWELSSGGLTNFNITSLLFDPDLPDRVYAGAENGSFISDNRGKSWQPFTIRLGYVSDIRMH